MQYIKIKPAVNSFDITALGLACIYDIFTKMTKLLKLQTMQHYCFNHHSSYDNSSVFQEGNAFRDDIQTVNYGLQIG